MTLSGFSVAYYRYIMKYAVKRFARFAEVVWDIDSKGKSEEQLASEGIDPLAAWIKEIVAASDISSLGVTEDMLESIADASIFLDGGYRSGNSRDSQGEPLIGKRSKLTIIHLYSKWLKSKAL